MGNLFVSEQWTDAEENLNLGNSGIYETFTDSTGELYKAMQKEYGRCVSKMYIDTADGTAQQVGWVFQKRQKYDDCDQTYLQETWVTVHTAQPDVQKKYHYAAFGKVA